MNHIINVTVVRFVQDVPLHADGRGKSFKI